MSLTEEHVSLDTLNELSAPELLRWAVEHHGPRAAIITSFQDTGCVMINLASQFSPMLRVLTVDTLRLHPETYDVMKRVEERYGLAIERFQPAPDRLERMVRQHGEYLFFDSKAKQEFCCQVRKVEPNRAALATVDVWITGLRRDQSGARGQVPKASYVEQDERRILKLAPLADWTHTQVWEYLRENQVPYNRLYDQGYTSIGCVICTTPTQSHEARRAGRWRWFNALDGDNKECGIHTEGSGI